MSVVKFIFVLMLCLPIAYLMLRLIVKMIDNLVVSAGSRKRRRRGNKEHS
ncbi:MAG: hypothetical protein ACOX41_09675 [Anaerovoracaceae bacterium]|jgi:hypothetical protein